MPRANQIARVVLWLVALAGAGAEAATPRWTTGAPYFNSPGNIVLWYTNSPLYYTDPGDLSAYVNHAAADAMVAAAAGVWNVPVSMMALQQGGVLNEQVSSSNTYLGSSGLVFPADVQSTNYAAKQIAVIYDRDGSVTDLLLGGGASDPSGCLQNAVTESVDSITPAGTIQHAVILLNGRCTGAAPEKQLQMQYQLERVFGRVLGLGWSQLNDNVFMGTPQPTYDQALHWPIMHPIDVVCGVYTYQCLPQPFTLRDDDIASLVFLYPVDSNTVPAGKQGTLSRASSLQGGLQFPNQEGMAGTNIVVRRNLVPQQVMDGYDDVSMVSGVFTQQLGGNPITPKPTGIAGSLGEIARYYDVAGYFVLPYIPIPDGQVAQDLLFHTEAINPLYVGPYSIAPYPLSPVTPSGDTISWRFNYVPPYWSYYYRPPIANIASNCSTGSDGTETSPAAIPASGWWNGLSCGTNASADWWFGHTSWVSLPVRANRSLTVEMTALDESGLVTASKVRPVVGVWKSADAIGSRPSLGSAAVAFNSMVRGLTTASAQTAQADTLRIAFAAENGDGRPDYNYQARVLYADTISPATGSAGTPITITGTGFRSGNTVTVNGVTASVTSWTATTIVAKAPRLASVLPGATATVDVTVTDLSTRGTTTMAGSFQYVYTAPVYVLQVVSAPTGSQIVGLAVTPAFSVSVMDADGITPLANAPVVFSAVSGSVSWSACPAAICTVLTDSTGVATITPTPLGLGTVTLQAAAVGQTQQVSFNGVALVRSASVSPQYKYLAAGATATWTVTAHFTQQGQPAAQAPVVWSSTGGGLSISAPQTATNTSGDAQATALAGPLAVGAQATGSACGWGTTCATFTAFGVDPSQYAVIATGNGAQSVAINAPFVPVTLQITDALGNAVAGAPVHIRQTTSGWTQPCTGTGRCANAPVTQTTDVMAVSDGSGNLSVVPLDMGGAEVTSMVVSAGKQGYLALSLQRHP